MSMTVDLSGLTQLKSDLKAMAKRAQNKPKMLRAVGVNMVDETVKVFNESGPGWKATRRGNSPLLDTGRLSNSIQYSVEGDTVIIGSKVPYAGLMNYGGKVVPKNARWLAIPQSPPFSASEARRVKPRDFPTAFVLMKGPEGPGLYRKTSYGVSKAAAARSGGWKTAGKFHGVERLFAFVAEVTIPQRQFLKWTDPVLEKIATMLRNYVVNNE